MKDLRSWIESHAGSRLEIGLPGQSERLDLSLAMYLIVRDLMSELHAVGGGFMSQLEWGSDLRGVPLPVADIMESSVQFDVRPSGKETGFALCHRSRRPGIADHARHDLSLGWPSAAVHGFPESVGKLGDWPTWPRPWECSLKGDTLWEKKGVVDGDNSGSASFDWAAAPGSSEKEIMKRVSFPQADLGLFPRRGKFGHFRLAGRDRGDRRPDGLQFPFRDVLLDMG